MNHKWVDNKCQKCGIERQKKQFKRWQRSETVLKNGVWEDRHIYTYGIAWHYGKEHKFERPNCVPDFTSVFLCELRKQVKKGLLTNKNLKNE